MGKIDLEKLISSLIENKSSALNDIYIIDIFNALSDQGLEYRDGAIVEIESQELKKVEQEEIPELKEDEKIRQLLLRFVEYAMPDNYSDDFSKEDCLAWLEKQGEHANFRNKIQIGDKVTRNEDGVLVNLSQLNRVAKKQDKQNPADNAEPKFKVGDFIVNDFCMGRVVEITNDAYLLDTEQGITFSCNSARLWDIAKDAKDGDVLATDGGVCIFDGTLEEGKYPFAYCGITKRGFESYNGNLPFSHDNNIHPSTKEQHDLLFQKMHEAGYKWDADKKELKKIEEEVNDEDYGIDGLYHAQRILEKTLGEVDGYQSDDGILEHKCAISAVKELSKQKQELLTKEKALKNSPFVEQKPAVWSDEDEEMLKSIKYHLDCDNADIRCYGWIEELKDRVQPQPKQEWSEEDENNINSIASRLEVDISYWENRSKTRTNEDKKLIGWLKSLRPQKQQYDDEWSDEDKEFLKLTLSNLTELKDRYGEGYGRVGGCIDWLKSLKERCNWKPSDEQMNALNYVVNLMASSERPTENDLYYNILKSLRQQLKKLREE